MSGSLRPAVAALFCWGRGAGGGSLWSPGLQTAGSGAGGGGSTEELDEMVKKHKVVVFLKGMPEQPQCGFSNAVVQILGLHGLQRAGDPKLPQGIKDYSNWSTIPQVYLNGEFVGGCVILL
ncbi:glutaredoxin-related protein 5, mitochondrial-like [Nycticebus coucang]|uniref:glutaredoxin-related protein 5, mitochondrial-like n=1 Tax=Nycticebus coucang TaxID=9470 RepID=UPI00234DC28E|nr:glutaredoxin-related protein 5, mitochondrial-like [Nycticebus coucang]